MITSATLCLNPTIRDVFELFAPGSSMSVESERDKEWWSTPVTETLDRSIAFLVAMGLFQVVEQDDGHAHTALFYWMWASQFTFLADDSVLWHKPFHYFMLQLQPPTGPKVVRNLNIIVEITLLVCSLACKVNKVNRDKDSQAYLETLHVITGKPWCLEDVSAAVQALENFVHDPITYPRPEYIDNAPLFLLSRPDMTLSNTTGKTETTVRLAQNLGAAASTRDGPSGLGTVAWRKFWTTMAMGTATTRR